MMSFNKITKKRVRKVGLPPGTPVYTGEREEEAVNISIMDFTEFGITEPEAESIEDCFPYLESHTVTWINIDGIHKVDIIEKMGKKMNLHPLILEDIVNPQQRPKDGRS
jgi:magnesium transporter